MLSAEQREYARQRWMDMFEKVYEKNESIFRYGNTLVVTDAESLRCYGEDGKEYTLQIADWEREDE